MKLVLSLLSSYLELPASTTPQQLAEALIQLGHEVEWIETTGGTFPNTVIGKILSREQHPSADKLGVCMVDVGEGAPRQIVCGAPNARAGLTVAVAMPGATLPGDFTIKVSKIRAVESNGMICSQRELGLGNEYNGIWEMETNLTPGTPLNDYFGPGETVLELSITPNRGDCFSHLGVARDLAALGLGTLKPLTIPAPGKAKPTITAATTTADCPQLNLLTITGTANGPSPRHIQSQLEAAGLRAKNLLVDATNYTMLALGQPLHAYDAAKTKGTLTAAAAAGGESFHGLGDANLTLSAGDVVITDASGIVGLGGILGGTSTAVSDATTNVILEAAYFNPVRIALSGQQHQLHTDARQRFERGVDPALTQQALLFCAGLIQQWGGGEVSAVATAGEGAAASQPFVYHPAFFYKYIGFAVPNEQQKTILENLGFTIKEVQSGWLLTPPTWRTYMATPEDITEEILRVVGYSNVEPQLPPTLGAQFQVDSAPIALDRTARRAMAAAGFLESISYSFIGTPEATRFIAEPKNLISLANPLAQTDMTTLRPSLLPGLLGALKANLSKSEACTRLAEVGKTYEAKSKGAPESLMAAAILAPSGQRHWKMKEAMPDVFAAKTAAYQVLQTLGAPVESGQVEAKAPGYYHPGRSGTLSVGPFTLATFGELHPAILKAYGLNNVAAFELHLEPLLKLQNKPRPYTPMPYPPVHRDLAFLLPATVNAAQVVASIRASNRDVLKRIEVFDHYVGDKIPAGKQSLAISLTLQSAEKTLAEADITPVIEAAVKAVETQHSGQLRS